MSTGCPWWGLVGAHIELSPQRRVPSARHDCRGPRQGGGLLYTFPPSEGLIKDMALPEELKDLCLSVISPYIIAVPY